ncbi:MAG TPA: FecR domain-containing protein [Lacibacter sp.]|nr:FecR domain-containing protein [Lacibacter sp.]
MTNKERIWHLFARKLTGDASVQERQELEQLLRNDAAMHYEILMIEQLWEAETPVDSDYLEATYLLHHQKMQKLGIEPGKTLIQEAENEFHPSPRRYLTVKRVAAIMVAAVIITASVIWLTQKPSSSLQAATLPVQAVKTAVTKNGTRTKLTLPDGTGVWLNAGSKLNYEKVGEGSTREVYLTGEAYFDVVRNPKRPFIIHTSAMDVKVLGTQFNVKAYPDDATVETSLIHGSVQVFLKNEPGKSYLLKPNEKLVLYKNKVMEGPKVSGLQKPEVSTTPKVAIQKLSYVNGSALASETAWTHNMLSFTDETFEEVAQKMERWFNVEVEFKNEQLKDVRLTGSFENETLQQAIAALQFSTRFQFTIENNRLLIY